MAPDPRTLIDTALLGKLDALELVTTRVFRGRTKGERRSKNRGVSVEFADYRDYARGDDTRHLDWNIYGRLGRLFIKLYQEEEDLAFYVIIDCSESMNFGSPATKFEYARRLAAALGYVALASQDKVGATGFAQRAGTPFRPARGKGQLPRLLRYLAELKTDKGTSLRDACRDFVMQNRQPGIVVLISDFLDEAGYEDALKHFFMREYEVYCLHLLSPEERNPDMGGHLELIDAETGDRQEVTVTGALLEQYRRTLEAWCGDLRDWCTARGMTYLPLSTDTPLEKVLLSHLRLKGLLR
jgi:uncharacterized protein (DUF58 family)